MTYKDLKVVSGVGFEPTPAIAANPCKYDSIPRDIIPEAIIQGLRTRIAEL